MYQGAPIWDHWEHRNTVTDAPTTRGGRTETLSGSSTPLGTEVQIHSIIAGISAAGNLVLLRGDGSSYGFTSALSAMIAGVTPWVIDLTLFDGLSIQGGTAGFWIVTYRIITPARKQLTTYPIGVGQRS